LEFTAIRSRRRCIRLITWRGEAEAGGYQPLHLALCTGQLPPVNAFWSLTMYDEPASLLVANPLNRYLINSPMLPQLKRDADGGLTLIVQNESPGKDKEATGPNAKGPFSMIMRLYWRKRKRRTASGSNHR